MSDGRDISCHDSEDIPLMLMDFECSYKGYSVLPCSQHVWRLISVGAIKGQTLTGDFFALPVSDQLLTLVCLTVGFCKPYGLCLIMMIIEPWFVQI